MGNATPALQAAAAASSTIPVVGTSITDYATALEIADWTGATGSNITGTADLAPLDEQAAMIPELFPEAKNVGIVYCSAEPNSVYQANIVIAELEAAGLTCEVFTFADSNDVANVVSAACAASDVLYIPTDNVAADCTGAILGAIGDTPVIAGEENLCKGCGVATLSISYLELGRITGEMAVKILKDEAKVEEMAVQFASAPTKKYNKQRCEELGIDTAALEAKGYIAIETE